MSIPYISLKLSKDQIEQAGRYRHIELNSSQKSQMRKIVKGDYPNLLEIITAPYNDCACGLFFYGLWASRDEVQVGKDYLKYMHDKEVKDYLDTTKSIGEYQQKMHIRGFNIDMSGNIYQKGKIANNLKDAFEAVEASPKPEYGDKYIWVSTPPLKDPAVFKKVRSAYVNIKKFFADRKYTVYAYFEHEYITNVEKGYNKLPAFSAESTTVDLVKELNGCSVKCGTKWKTEASSFATWRETKYRVSNLLDNSLATAWVEGVPGHGIDETLIMTEFVGTSEKAVALNGLLVANGFQKSKDLFEKNSRVKSFLVLVNNEPKYLLHFMDKMGYQRVTFPEITVSRKDTLTLRIVDVFGGVRYQDTGISLLLPSYTVKK